MLVFLLLAGEIYTTFTFLGGSGWAYGKGAPAFYIIAYGSLAYIMSYWLLPAIWQRATEWRVVSQPEIFARTYNSRLLGTVVALVSVVALIPYLVLQLKGLGIIVAETSYGAIGSTAAIWIGTCSVVVYVVLAGIHGSAMTAAIKDVLVLLVFVFFVGFAALLSVPGLEGSDADLALLRITRETYGPFIVGVVGSAGLLTALVPGSMILMATATLLARTIRPTISGAGGATIGFARWLVPVIAGVALIFTFRGGDTLVTLLLMGYALVTQLFPALLAALWPPARVTATGAMVGILSGVGIVGGVTLSGTTAASLLPSWPAAITDINIGVLALVVNIATMFAVSRLSARTVFTPQPLLSRAD